MMTPEAQLTEVANHLPKDDVWTVLAVEADGTATLQAGPRSETTYVTVLAEERGIVTVKGGLLLGEDAETAARGMLGLLDIAVPEPATVGGGA